MSIRPCLSNTLAALLLALIAASPVYAAVNPLQLLDNYVHYARTGQFELAEANARQLLDTVDEDAEMARLLDEGRVTMERYEDALRRAQGVPELEEIAAELDQRIESGRLGLARDHDRIEEAIRMITGTQRERLLGRQRLRAAGEYAVPNLLRRITDDRDQGNRIAAENMLREIGRLAVTPLSVALAELGDHAAQRIVCDILGDIGYAHAAPYLIAFSNDETLPQNLRDAARRAVQRLDMPEMDFNLAEMWTWIGHRYFDDARSLIAYPDEEQNNVWRYHDTVGLTPINVPTAIYGRVMAMMASREALALDVNHRDALALFVAANLKRENDLPDGAADPIFGDLDYTPSFYATVFGTQTCLDVLGMAIDAHDTPLVRDAIDALSRTTGGANLFAYGEGRRPLLEAMDYPDRRVQYESALTLARALPKEGFAGDYTVVPKLASAVRTGDRQFAVVMGDDDEDRRTLANRLDRLGYEIVATEASLASIRDSIDYAIGVDLIAVRMRTPDRAQEAVSQLRGLRRLAVTPMLVLADHADVPGLRLEYRERQNMRVSRFGLDDDAFRVTVENLMDRAVGGRITEAEAEVYAIEALDALRDVAISDSSVYEISDAESALLDALETRIGGTRMLVADILALIDSSRAQQRLCDAALAADDFEQIELFIRTADSVKRFGNRLQDRHVNALLAIIADATGERAEAASELYGAMNLPTEAAVQFLP